VNLKSYQFDEDLKPHEYSDQRPPSIGVISFLTQQRDYLRGRIEEWFDAEEIERHRLFVGTPEEFQGNERDIVFITFGLDSSIRYAKSFYEEPRRFNVATSRAVDFTYAVYGGMPISVDLVGRYLRRFDPNFRAGDDTQQDVNQSTSSAEHWYWTYDRRHCESEFERRVAEFLENFSRVNKVRLFNQVTCCGQKRLDFVLFNERTESCVAVEVDGRDHFTVNGRSYSEAHLERIDILERAGWKILHVPYYSWYKSGWLCETADPEFQTRLANMSKELRHLLQCND
jgi:very-short-patch-repair endonuclease